jgi:hypothetical protein
VGRREPAAEVVMEDLVVIVLLVVLAAVGFAWLRLVERA